MDHDEKCHGDRHTEGALHNVQSGVQRIKKWLSENDWGENLYLSRFNSQLQLERLVGITGKR